METEIYYINPNMVRLDMATKGCLYRVDAGDCEDNLIIPMKISPSLSINSDRVLVLRLRSGNNWVAETMLGNIVVHETFEVAQITVEGSIVDN